MAALKSLTAAARLSIMFVTQPFAQSFSEPAAFEAQYPDRDVLNGGALTPAAKAEAAARLESSRGFYDGMGSTSPQLAHRAQGKSRRHR